MSEQYQTITIDLDRESRAGGVRVDGEKVKKTTSIALSSAIGVGNFLRIEGFATRQMIRAVIAILERLIGKDGDPNAVQLFRGKPTVEGITIEGVPLTDLDSVSLIIDSNEAVRLIVVKQVEEIALTLHGQKGRS
jgi:hypothetical protein